MNMRFLDMFNLSNSFDKLSMDSYFTLVIAAFLIFHPLLIKDGLIDFRRSFLPLATAPKSREIYLTVEDSLVDWLKSI